MADSDPKKSPDAQALRALLIQHISAFDRPAAVAAATAAVAAGSVGIAELYADVLAPLLVTTGAEWQSGAMRVWQEHFTSATVRTIVEALYPRVQELKASARAAAPHPPKKILLACPPGEVHDLGLRMLADRFELAGWEAYFLGADTPLTEVVAATRALGVDAVALSASTHFERVIEREIVDRLKADLPKVSVWVGGAAFAKDHEGFTDEEALDPDTLLGDPGGDGATRSL